MPYNMLSEGNITLRPLQESDRQVLATLANNKKIWDNLRDTMPHPYSEADADFFIGLCQKENPQLTFGITFEGQLCGVVGLIAKEGIYRKSAEIGYWIGEPYWGQGIATTAVQLLTQYAFEVLGLIRIQSAVFEYNPASMRVLEKCGYQKEGIFRKALIKNGNVWDEHRFAILAAE